MTVAHVRPDVAKELAGLKDFQRATVDRVHARFWDPIDPARRFLVADEVGLGKTMVARGVITRAIDHLWDREERIDVIYICSNAQIARQNLGRLALDGFQVDHADRLTMLPEAMKGLRANKVNFVSFTPGTSFQVHESGGHQRERVLLQRMLARTWGAEVRRAKGWAKFFRGRVDLTSYEAALAAYNDARFDDAMAEEFGHDVSAATAYTGRPLAEELQEAVVRFRHLDDRPHWELSRHRYRLIGQLRNLLARAAVESLEPDLVILDEFQRFKDLLAHGQPGADLAHAIFDQPSARVLLLSATPYKMYTLPDEAEGDDHYDDFRGTVTFLGGPDAATAVMGSLRNLREALLDGPRLDDAKVAKEAAESQLRRFMSRTERLRSSADLDGMLREMELPATTPTSADLVAYVGTARVAEALGAPDPFEYWRASPYCLNIMEGYKVKNQLKAALAAPPASLVEVLTSCPGLLNWEDVETYQQIDPGNAKMRGLVADVLDRGAWQLLWLPPTLPYYSPNGSYADPDLQTFTKRLVFSAWNVVPKAIGVVLSYEAERRATEAAGRAPRRYSATRPTGLLRFQIDGTGRAAGLPTFALLYPSLTLARLGDPLAIARDLGELPVDRKRLLDLVAARLARALEPFGPGTDSAVADQRWYWAAPMLLDRELGSDQEDFVALMREWGEDTDGESHQQRHVEEAVAVRVEDLGRQPEDLAQVLAQLAIAGPGVTALRALGRVCGIDGVSLSNAELRDSAAWISWGLRALFNRAESMAVVRAEEGGDAYWRAVLAHCVDGNLQAVLDEYLHVLIDAEGLRDKSGLERAEKLVDVLHDALTLQVTTAVVDEISCRNGRADLASHRARVHFAARFGRGQSEDQQVQRESELRTAYNSPFWPFVLASTSVGQEGLDFHQYSHAIVHWNLPGNPVDLEQREGRVHRFKGHAIRRNVALTHGRAALGEEADPWTAIFAAAKADANGTNDLVPFWIYAPPGGVGIERYVPVAPLSKEAARYRRLMRTVGAYRLVMGQPRQEDLLSYLGEAASDLSWLRIDLSPSSAQS